MQTDEHPGSYFQAGMTKTNAAKKTLTFINPDVEIKDYCFDITTPDNYRTLLT